jgi:hypothetical protein
MNREKTMNTEWWKDPRVRHWPIVLPNGCWNLASADEWLETGAVMAGPPAHRSPLTFGTCTHADLQAHLRVLRACAGVNAN